MAAKQGYLLGGTPAQVTLRLSQKRETSCLELVW